MFHITVDERLLRTLAAFVVTPQGQTVLAWMKEMHRELCATFPDMRDEIDIRQSQGEAFMLQQLLEAFESAPPLAMKQKDHGR